ncbi:MAG: sialate O-acetylesterase [Bacteroidota bacterium]
MKLIFCYLLLSLCMAQQSFSQLRLPSVLSSGMVLQQNDSVTIWGWGYNNQKVKAIGSWTNDTSTTTVNNRAQWSMKLKTPAAGGPYSLRISHSGTEIVLTDVLIGEVWLCSGQSNMEMSFNTARHTQDDVNNCYNKNIRFFNIPRMASDYPQEDLRAAWKVCDSNSLKSFTAVGYYFGKKINQDMNVPVGLISSSWGGTPAETWTPDEDIYNNETLKKTSAELKEVPWGPVKPGLNYNGMIAPLIKFDIAGALWYQGEANVGNNHGTHALLLTNMINAWRKKWKKEFPFYYVQIAPYKYPTKDEGAFLQEQQTKAMNYPNTGMVVITDLVDTITDIHPRNKKDVGLRLANWALAETYHQNIIGYKSPSIKKVEADKDKLILSFENAPNGLIAKDKNINGFFISGEDEGWLAAEAKIEKDKIIVWNKTITKPVYVRYGFGDTIIGNVFSKEGLPVIPFRTDNWTK